MNTLDAALAYASRGWRVLPCCWINPTPGGCSCGDPACPSPGKHPLTRRGVHDASLDAETVKAWWRRWPDANVAIAAGDGLVVLDVDVRNGGDASLTELERDYGEIRTLTARTGGGGLHLYFRGDLPQKLGFRDGLDLKAAGGYVIAPPSQHTSGRRYTWVALGDLPQAPQPVPSWLARIVDPPRPTSKPPAAWQPPNYSSQYVARAIERECLAVANAAEGTRNDTLNRAAFAIARFVASGQATESEVRAALTIAARHAGLSDHEIGRTIDSAFGARRAA